MRKILVTGGAGFIGSAVVRHLIEYTQAEVVNVDCLTYAGNLETLAAIANEPRYCLDRVDICDARAIQRVFAEHQPSAIVHLAAESHVDRSIDGPAAFIRTNVIGTYTLLEAAREHYCQLPLAERERFRFLHVSTDEVYGSLGESGFFSESSPYDPSSPYSASKASADHLVRAWHRTYGLPTLITNCSNNYGPYQHPEKLIPRMIQNALSGNPLPVYGEGQNIRDWLYVDDHVRALLTVLECGTVGQTYAVGGSSERTNLEVVRAICQLMDDLQPASPYVPHHRLIEFVPDRPGHDYRYAIDACKLRRELNWQPAENFEGGLRKTVQWYLANRGWCRAVTSRRSPPPIANNKNEYVGFSPTPRLSSHDWRVGADDISRKIADADRVEQPP